MRCRLCGRLLNQFDEGEGEKMTLQEAQELYEAAVKFDETGIAPENSPLRKWARLIYPCHESTKPGIIEREVKGIQLREIVYMIFRELAKEHMTIHHAVPEPSKAEKLATVKHLLEKIRNIQLSYENNRSEILKFANFGLTSDFPSEALKEIQRLAQCPLRYRKEEKKDVEIAGLLMKKAIDLESLKGFYDN